MKLYSILLLSVLAGGQTSLMTMHPPLPQTKTMTFSGPVTTARIADCDDLVGEGGRIYTLRQLGYCDWAAPKPEPIDVPAITAKRKTCAKYYSITTDGHAYCEIYKDEEYPTCADKKRIIMEDLEDPPTYWCHKPQTEPKP